MVKKMLAIGCVVLAVSACNRTATQHVSGAGGAAGLQIVTMEDGTKCAVIVGDFKGGISCDWK